LDAPAAPTFQIKLGGETRTLMYGFRAFKALGINPFKPSELRDFYGDLSVDKAAEWVRAGLLWQYAKGQELNGQEPPTADDLLDLLDMANFNETFELSVEVAGLTPKNGESEPAETGETTDPPTA